MRTILINIDAGPVNCDGCEMMTRTGTDWWCFVWPTDWSKEHNMPRPTECLEAEMKALGMAFKKELES